MKKFALMVLVIGLVGVFSGIASGQTGDTEEPHYRDLFLRRFFSVPFDLKDIYFASDSFELDSKAKKILEQNVNWLKDNPSVRVEIQGHTDQRGDNDYNLSLGERRVNAVKIYLVAQGISKDRVSAIGYGEEKPFCNKDTEECHRQNNRVHFLKLRR